MEEGSGLGSMLPLVWEECPEFAKFPYHKHVLQSTLTEFSAKFGNFGQDLQNIYLDTEPRYICVSLLWVY